MAETRHQLSEPGTRRSEEEAQCPAPARDVFCVSRMGRALLLYPVDRPDIRGGTGYAKLDPERLLGNCRSVTNLAIVIPVARVSSCIYVYCSLSTTLLRCLVDQVFPVEKKLSSAETRGARHGHANISRITRLSVCSELSGLRSAIPVCLDSEA